MKKLTLFFLILISLQACSKSSQWEKFNSSLLIEVTRPKGVFTCTGVAVSETILITAAHCLEGEIKKVRVFTQKRYDPKLKSLTVKSFSLHPLYNPKKSRYLGDLARVTLTAPLPSSIKIHSIYKGDKIFGKLYRFGYGARENKNLRTAIMPTLRKMDTKEHILELNDKFSRSGDSGGPIFMESEDEIKLLAIHSTFSHGPEGNFSLNPLLGTHIDWIFKQ